MTIIEKLKDILTNCSIISDITDSTIHINFNDDEDKSFSLEPIGDQKISENIYEHEKRSHHFVLYQRSNDVESAFDDEERQNTLNSLLELGYWLEKIKEQAFDLTKENEVYNAEINDIVTANAMLFDPVHGLYQIQIIVTYTIKNRKVR